MKTYLSFHADGRIRNINQSQDDDPAPEGMIETTVEGITPFSHVLRNGELVALTEEQSNRLRNPQYMPATWDNDALDWIDARPLATYKEAKIIAIKNEGLIRIQAQVPGLNSFDTVELVRELWLSIAAAARQPTTKLSTVISIYQAGTTAVAQVRTASTKAEVDAVVVNWP